MASVVRRSRSVASDQTSDEKSVKLESDYIPKDILFALTQRPVAKETYLAPVTKFKSLPKTKKPPAAVWNFPGRREKFKHLLNAPCICGAGQDISFLYDVEKPAICDTEPSKFDPSGERKRELTLLKKDSKNEENIRLPDTLIPEEFHVVKSKATLGLEYHDEKYGSTTDDHESHLTVFPSLNPTSRFEVMRLKESLNEMLEKAGLNDIKTEEVGPTQMHNLIELIKKEQAIYNIVFHELIRQTTIDCSERGELLQELRQRYSAILSRVPKQINGLHEEVLAQRALDRRLTDELIKFKKTITSLTEELLTVKQHDEDVSKSANLAKDELKEALIDSKKNSDLLLEYHDLYELQRLRMEKNIERLTDEKELWSKAAYSLAMKIMEERSLTNCKRLNLAEKAWTKLAHHFTILLSDYDSSKLSEIQLNVDKFRESIMDFQSRMKRDEKLLRESIGEIKEALIFVQEDFDRKVFENSIIAYPPNNDKCKQILAVINKLLSILNCEIGKFSGENVLEVEESLNLSKTYQENWTELALEIFDRHKIDKSNDLKSMKVLNMEMVKMLFQCTIRLTGENGVARKLISLSTNLESWQSKLHTTLHGSNPIQNSEWLRLYNNIKEWIIVCDSSTDLVGLTKREFESSEDDGQENIYKHYEINDMMTKLQKWLSSTTNGIESENARLLQEVALLHTDMVFWMIHVLLKLVPNLDGHSPELLEIAEMIKQTDGQIKETVLKLFNRLRKFNSYLFDCCSLIVRNLTQQRLARYEDNAEQEQNDFNRMKIEMEEWIKLAKLLVTSLTGEDLIESDLPKKIKSESASKSKEKNKDTDIEENKEEFEESKEDIENEEEKEEGETEIFEKQLKKATEITVDTELSSTLSEKQFPVEIDKEEEITSKDIVDIPVDKIDILIENDVEQKTETVKSEFEETLKMENELIFETDIMEESTKSTEVEKEEEEKAEKEEEIIIDTKEKIQTVAYDETTTTKYLEGEMDEKGLLKPKTEMTKKAYEGLEVMQNLQAELINTEERAQVAEAKIIEMEMEMRKMMDNMAEMKFKLKNAEKIIKEIMPIEKSMMTTADSIKTEEAAAADANNEKKDTDDSSSQNNAKSKLKLNKDKSKSNLTVKTGGSRQSGSSKKTHKS